MNFYNKSKFSGYKVRPVYLERVNNYLNGVYESQQQNQTIEDQHTSSSLSSPLTHSNPHSISTIPQQQHQQQEQKAVSISDLRNKRQNIQNNTYSGNRGNMSMGKSKPSYRVNVSYANGSFQTDGL